MGIDIEKMKLRFARKAEVLNLSPKYDDADWLAKQVRKGRLTQTMVDLIPQLKEAGEIAYPGMWDIQFDYQVEIRTTVHTNDSYNLYDFRHDELNILLGGEDTPTEEALLNRYGPDTVRRHLYRLPGNLEREFEFISKITVNINYVRLIIHFPEVTISNKYNQSHDIKDLFIALSFNPSGQVTTNIEGARSTYSELEVIGGYIHSHLRSTDFTIRSVPLRYTNFCKGTGSINACLSFYNSDKSLPNLLSILYHLNTTANHESIDGGPHYRMETLQAKEGLSTAPSEEGVIRAWDTLTNAIARKGSSHVPSPLDWKYENPKYTIIDNIKLNDFCVEYLKGTEAKKWLVLRADNGQLYKKTESLVFNRNSYPLKYDHFIPFKGRRYEFTVYSKPGPVITDQKVYIHPLIKSYVKSKLESYAAKAAFKSSAIEYLDKIGNH